MTLRGGDLAKLLGWLGARADDLARITDWLDEHGGNGRSEALLTQARASLLLAEQQLMRDLEFDDRPHRRSEWQRPPDD